MKQQFLNFPLKSIYSAEDFFISSANIRALEMIKKWPFWGEGKYGKALLLYGEEGCGKSHLAHIWQKIAKAKFLDKELYYDDLYFNEKALIIEDIDNLDQEALLHLINIVEEKDQYLLLTSRLSPANLNFTLNDLRSRILAIPSISINAPDEELFKAVLLKHLSDRSLYVNMVAIDYIMPRIDRSFTKLIRFINKLESISNISKRPITIPLIKEVI